MEVEELVKITPNIIVADSSEPKHGKSTFAATFPAPIEWFSFDIGLSQVMKKFSDKKITVRTYELPIVETVRADGHKKEILEVWKTFKADFIKATENPEVKTIVLDTATALYEICRIARTGELGRELDPREYGDVYLRMKALIQRCRLSGQNLVLTHYLKSVYKDDKETGEKVIDAAKPTLAEVDVSLIIKRVTETDPKGRKLSKFISTIADTRFDGENLTGFELVNATYDDLVAVLGLEE